MKELGIYDTFDNKQYDVKFDSKNNRLIAIGPLNVAVGSVRESIIENVFSEADAPRAFKQFSMKRNYKGFVIEASPDPLIGGRWSTKVIIRKYRGDSITQRPFSTDNIWDSEIDAVNHSFNFGKQIVDGKADVSINDL